MTGLIPILVLVFAVVCRAVFVLCRAVLSVLCAAASIKLAHGHKKKKKKKKKKKTAAALYGHGLPAQAFGRHAVA